MWPSCRGAAHRALPRFWSSPLNSLPSCIEPHWSVEATAKVSRGENLGRATRTSEGSLNFLVYYIGRLRHEVTRRANPPCGGYWSPVSPE